MKKKKTIFQVAGLGCSFKYQLCLFYDKERSFRGKKVFPQRFNSLFFMSIIFQKKIRKIILNDASDTQIGF